jgi:hypothetical protein
VALVPLLSLLVLEVWDSLGFGVMTFTKRCVGGVLYERFGVV